MGSCEVCDYSGRIIEPMGGASVFNLRVLVLVLVSLCTSCPDGTSTRPLGDVLVCKKGCPCAGACISCDKACHK